MIVQQGITSEQRGPRGGVVTLGNFDGVHLGHQALIRGVLEYAQRKDIASTLVTFDPLPQVFFGRASGSTAIMSIDEKIDFLSNLNIDRVLVLPFDESLASCSADDFVRKIIADTLQASHVIVGDDFRFGRGRSGDVHTLAQLGQRWNFTADSMSTVTVAGSRVSSTRLRQALAENDFDLAQRLLGRAFSVRGPVVHGDKVGRTLGMPTANINAQHWHFPGNGIYIVSVTGAGLCEYPAVASLGVRPTIGGERRLLEVHLIDFNQDLYGKTISVNFHKKIRNEERFGSLMALKDAMECDLRVAKRFFEMSYDETGL